jgi:hypothetical protein
MKVSHIRIGHLPGMSRKKLRFYAVGGICNTVR